MDIKEKLRKLLDERDYNNQGVKVFVKFMTVIVSYTKIDNMFYAFANMGERESIAATKAYPVKEKTVYTKNSDLNKLKKTVMDSIEHTKKSKNSKNDKDTFFDTKLWKPVKDEKSNISKYSKAFKDDTIDIVSAVIDVSRYI